MGVCRTCGGAIFASGEVIGYGGPVCSFSGNHGVGTDLAGLKPLATTDVANPPKATTNEDAELSKVCSACYTPKPLSEYYFYNATNRYDVRCKPCKNRYDREWYAKNRQKHLNRIKNYRQSSAGKANQTRSHYTSLEKYPEKHIARGKLRYAVARGKIKKQNCEVCDSAKSEAHHYLGYSESHWYDVKWLCRKHHFDAHNFSLESRGVL